MLYFFVQKTSTGDVKIIDLRDSTGSGDVDISTIVKVTSREDESIQGLSGRKLKVKKINEDLIF
jgi:tripeptidyl-peptidase-2